MTETMGSGNWPMERDRWVESLSAIRTVRGMRTILFSILILALLVPLVVYGVNYYSSMMQPSTTSAPAVGQDWQRWLPMLMTAGAFCARLAVVLLLVVYFLTAQICLTGRLGGTHDALSGLMWMVVLMLWLVPWHHWMTGQPMHLVFYEVSQLQQALSGLGGDWISKAEHYSQFLVMPLLGLLTAVVADIRVGRGCRTALRRIQLEIEGAGK
ncbi:MAG: hypothetical protein HJJLKODD_02497 [Phycisphaerae bacterium]|nr:hypothetical protein [Phycisphaerae bacterium]